MKNIYFLFLLNLVFSFGEELSSYCDEIQGDEVAKDRMGTKTGYFAALKNPSYWESFRKQTSECTPLKVWFLTRHGTRYPVTNDFQSFFKLPLLVEEIIFNHLMSRGCLTENYVFEYKRWVPYFDEKDKGQLHTTGFEELFGMGEYWRDLFPSIFGRVFDSSKVKVEFTTRNRTGQSAYHFLRGMYGDEAVGKIKLPEPYEPNFVLRLYKSCTLWLRDVYRNNQTTYKERNLFEQTKEFQDMLQSVSSRLGYVDKLELADMIVMYDACRYEAAWFPARTSIWCKPFSHRDIELLEYYQDLKYYYEDSYGTPMNKEIACKTVSNLYTHLKDKVSSSESVPNGVLYFSHDKTLLKFEALLGLFEPAEPLKHDNMDMDRIFRSSVVAPFATNLGFILYKCENAHKVGMMFEGNPTPLSSVCPDILCDWEKYEAFFRPIYENCDMAKTCGIHDEL